MKILKLMPLLLACSTPCLAHEVKSVETDLQYSLPAIDIAEYVVAHLKLSTRYLSDPKIFEKLSLTKVYVASVIDDKNLKYVFVGIPYKDSSLGGYEAILQYCSYDEEYLFGGAGWSSLSTRKQFERFKQSRGMAVPDTDDFCKMRDPAR